MKIGEIWLFCVSLDNLLSLLGVLKMKQVKNVILSVSFMLVFLPVCIAEEIEQMDMAKILKLPQEHWYNSSMLGKKIGYDRIYIEMVDFQGEKMLRITTDTKFQVQGLGKDLKTETTKIGYSDLKLRPRYFIYTHKGTYEKKIEGEIKDGTVHIKTTLNGKATESEVEIPENTILNSVYSFYLLFQNRLKIGEKMNYTIFDLDLLKPVKTEVNVKAKENISYQSDEVPVYVIDEKRDMMGGLTLRNWITSEGTVYKTSTDLMGLSVKVSKTDKRTALGLVEDVDLVFNTRIVPTGKKPRPNASRLEVNLQLSKGNLKDTIIIDSRQKLLQNSKRTGKLLISKQKINAEDCPKIPIQDPELKDFLSTTVFVETDHPDIRAKAVEIIEGEENSWRAAKKLCKWVDKSIRDKHISGGYNSALSTLKSSVGDCTEHTVLLIALARSVGIPARICSGLVYVDKAFYFHFWPEVYIGTWIQMDPTLGQTIADANHLQLVGSTVESDTMLELAEGVFRTVNQLEIEILD